MMELPVFLVSLRDASAIDMIRIAAKLSPYNQMSFPACKPKQVGLNSVRIRRSTDPDQVIRVRSGIHDVTQV